MPKNKAQKRKTNLEKIWMEGAARNVVGPLIRKLRNERKMTQERLTALCQVHGLDMSRGTLAKIEARLRLVKACELYVIAKVLKVPMESFYPTDFGTPHRGQEGRRV